jgi:hypothetical protein
MDCGESPWGFEFEFKRSRTYFVTGNCRCLLLSSIENRYVPYCILYAVCGLVVGHSLRYLYYLHSMSLSTQNNTHIIPFLLLFSGS